MLSSNGVPKTYAQRPIRAIFPRASLSYSYGSYGTLREVSSSQKDLGAAYVSP